MTPVKTPVAAMQARCIAALYDAELVGGVYAADLLPKITETGNEKRAWNVLLDLVEAERVVQAAGPASHGGPRGARYKLSPSEHHAEWERRFFLYKPKEKYVERGNA